MNHKRVLVRKVHKVSLFRIDQYESWLSDMAAKGLVLRKIDYIFCYFVKTRPRMLEYRVVISKNEMTKEQVESLEKKGWKKVIKRRNGYIFSGDENMKKEEIYRSTKEQAKSMKSYLHMMQRQLMIMGFLLPLYMAFVGYILTMEGSPFLELVTTGISWILQPMYVLIYGIIILWELIGVRKAYRQLMLGKVLNHHSSWRRCHYVYGGIIAVSVSLLLLQGVDFVYSISRLSYSRKPMEASSIQTEKDVMPILRLSTLEKEPLYMGVEKVKRNQHFSNQWVKEDRSLLGPIQYRTYEIGQVEGKRFLVSKKEYMPSIAVEYYQLASSLLAKGVFGDLVKRYREEDRSLSRNQEWKKVSVPGVEQVYYAKSGDEICIVARKKRQVLQVVYIGNVKREVLFQEISKRL